MKLEIRPNLLDFSRPFSQTLVFSFTEEEIVTCLSVADLRVCEKANESESIAEKMSALALIARRIEDNQKKKVRGL